MFSVVPTFQLKDLEIIFPHKVFMLLLSKGKVTQDLVSMLMSWRHSGFNMFCGPRIWPGNEGAMEDLDRYIIRWTTQFQPTTTMSLSYFQRPAGQDPLQPQEVDKLFLLTHNAVYGKLDPPKSEFLSLHFNMIWPELLTSKGITKDAMAPLQKTDIKAKRFPIHGDLYYVGKWLREESVRELEEKKA